MPQNETTTEEGKRLTSEGHQEEQIGLPPPPDGGYGWVIVFASFMCNLVVDGIGYTFGIFLPHLAKSFDKGPGTVAWVGSLLAGMLLIAGPVVSALCNKFGCRAVCIAGALVGAAAFALSTLCQNVVLMMLSYGVLGGFGFGMIYLPSIVAVGYYFDTKRSLATGIAVCGSGVGTVAFGPLATYLLSSLGSWQRANLALAAIILCCCVFGFLMKPLVFPETNEKSVAERIAEVKNQEEAQGANGTVTSDRLPRNVSTPVFTTGNPNLQKLGSVPSLNIRKTSFGDNAVYNSKLSIARDQTRMIKPLSRKDIFYSGSVHNLPQYQSQKSLQAFRKSMVSIPHSTADDVEMQSGGACGCVKSVFASMVDMSLLRDPAFLLIGVSNFFGMAGLYLPFVYLKDAAVAQGVSEANASYLISIIGFTNTVARLVCGYLADFPWMDSLMFNNGCLVIATFAVGLVPFCSSYASFIGVAVFFGIAIAGYISLTSIILVDILGLDKLTNAFGLLILFRGVATIVGTPIGGILYTSTGTYNATFYAGSIFFLLSAISSFAAKFFRKSPEAAKQTGDILARIDEDQEEDEHTNGYKQVTQNESAM